jgi:hypothetical protein
MLNESQYQPPEHTARRSDLVVVTAGSRVKMRPGPRLLSKPEVPVDDALNGTEIGSTFSAVCWGPKQLQRQVRVYARGCRIEAPYRPLPESRPDYP